MSTPNLNIEEIIISLQDKLRSADYLDNETAIDKFAALLQSQNTERQRKIVSTILPIALSSKFESIQKKTVQVASNYPTVLRDILPALRLSTNTQVRFWAIFMMVELKFLDRGQLIDLVNSKEPDEIRKYVLEVLSTQADKDIILLMLNKISDPSWIIRKQARRLLIEQGNSIYDIIKEFFLTCPSRQKYDCIKLIPQILKEKSLMLFQKMLEMDRSGGLKPYIAAGLSEIRSEAALAVLLQLLQDPSWLVREESIKSLTMWGDEAVNHAWNIFPTATQETRISLMHLCGRVLGTNTHDRLVSLFGSLSPENKYYLLTALSQVQDPMVVPYLINYLKDESVFIQDLTIKIMSALGVHALDHLLTYLDVDDEKVILPILRVIGEIGSKDALRPLLFLIDNCKDTLIRTCAIESISRLQKFELIAGLLLLKLDDPDISIRHTIVENLSKHPRDAFLKDLVLACMDRSANVSWWSREILRRRSYPGIPSFLQLHEASTDFEKDKMIALVSKLTDDQLDSVLKNERITFETLQPENVETKVLRRKYNKENVTDIKELLYYLHEEGGSDLHLNIGLPPSIRIHGELVRTTFETITPEKSRYLIYSLMNDAQKEMFGKNMELDFSMEVADCARFRVNVFMQKNGVAAVFRIIPNVVPTFEALSLDRAIMEKICNTRSGLILVTGATGSGKSTTLASMIDHINRTRYDHIITIEDPIEFVHPHKRSVVSQRELGTNTLSFSNALKGALREDPDVILVGEMRDLETMRLAIAAAETGHLVFSTLHTINASESIHRVVGSYPGDQQRMVQMQLAGTIRAIISQRLVPAYLSAGRVLAYEILIGNTPIKRCIKEDKIDQILSIMQTSRGDGMTTMDMCLEDLVIQKKVSFDDGLKNADDKKEFEKRVTERLSAGKGGGPSRPSGEPKPPPPPPKPASPKQG